jgi:hypothetical protein
LFLQKGYLPDEGDESMPNTKCALQENLYVLSQHFMFCCFFATKWDECSFVRGFSHPVHGELVCYSARGELVEPSRPWSVLKSKVSTLRQAQPANGFPN